MGIEVKFEKIFIGWLAIVFYNGKEVKRVKALTQREALRKVDEFISDKYPEVSSVWR